MYEIRDWIACGSLAASIPSTLTMPLSDFISPVRRRINVVLPAPSGPTRATSPPLLTEKEILSSASTFSPVSRRKDLLTPSRRNAGEDAGFVTAERRLKAHSPSAAPASPILRPEPYIGL